MLAGPEKVWFRSGGAERAGWFYQGAAPRTPIRDSLKAVKLTVELPIITAALRAFSSSFLIASV